MNKYRFAFEKTFSFAAPLECSEEFLKNFADLCLQICELEALTFLTDENKTTLHQCYTQLVTTIPILQTNTKRLNVDLLKSWRQQIGLFCCFIEWCEETCYFNLTEQERAFIWKENPLEQAIN